MPLVYLMRRESFCASHRLHTDLLSDDENRRLFGKCNSPNGHGHNYVLEVSLRGEPDLKTGLLMNLTELKHILQEVILSRVDHRHLNLDVAEFSKTNPTTENLAIVFWRMLEEKISKKLLYEVRVFETEKNSAYYRGE